MIKKKLGPSSRKNKSEYIAVRVNKKIDNDPAIVKQKWFENDPAIVKQKWFDDFSSLYKPPHMNDVGIVTSHYNKMQSILSFREDSMSREGYEENEMLNSDISYDEIEKIVKGLKNNKAVGIDNIPNEVLKNKDVMIMMYRLFIFCFCFGVGTKLSFLQ